MTSFIYDQLSSDEIRVLTLYPGSYGDALSGHLTTVRFAPDDNAKPDFEALSYTWGDQSNPELITLSQDVSPSGTIPPPLGAVAIGRNLVAALRQLRHPSESRRLWCDSICINQGSMPERASQVLLMGAIYTHTRRVIVWLGPASHTSGIAVEALRRAGSQLDHTSPSDDAGRNMITFREDADPAFRGQGNSLPFTDEEWRAIAGILARDWFRRLWIRQEITLASEDALVVVGDQSILWAELVGAVAMIRSKETFPSLSGLETETFRQDLTNVSTFRRMKVFRSLHGIISATQSCLCSDDRDRIYALLGMIDAELAGMIRPDYTLQVKDVYRDMVLKSIEYSERLAILDFCDAATEPTWVPDLHRGSTSQGRFDYTHASGDSEAVVSPVGQNGLRVHGIRCDGIVEHLAACASDASDDDLRRIVRDVLVHFLGRDVDIWEKKSLEMLTQSLVSGRTFELVEWINYRRVSRTASILERWARSDGVEAASLADEKMALASLQEFLPGRSLFKTESGSLVIASSHAQPSDTIYTILGLSNTMTLRKVQDGFHVVGPSYHPHFARAEAVCGQLPDGWRAVMDIGQPGPTFKKEGLLWQKQDPRLADVALPSGWQEGESEDGWPYWYDDGKGDLITWSDPRLRPEELRKRGVEVGTIILY